MTSLSSSTVSSRARSVLSTPAAFSIDEYKRKQQVLAASKKPRKRRSSASLQHRASHASTATTAASRRKSRAAAGQQPTYTKEQKAYLDFCVEKHVDPDMKLLTGIWSACIAAYKAPQLLRLELVGIHIVASATAKMLSKALVSSSTLEFVSFAQSKLGDSGIEDSLSIRFRVCSDRNGAGQMSEPTTAQPYRLPPDRQGKRPHFQNHNRTFTGKSVCTCLHGVLKDEDVWSSSLRGESVSAAASRPALLLDLSHNALGDESAQALCNALYHDKWLLGLNLSQNRISRNGIALLIDTLTQSNRTLAVLVVANMKDSVDHVNQRKLDTLMHQRRRVLQHLAFESREKRLVLCSLLLEWNVERDLVLEICQSSSSNESQSEIHASRLAGHSASSSAFSPSIASSSRSSAVSVASSSQVWTNNNAAVVGEEDFVFEHDDLEIDATGENHGDSSNQRGSLIHYDTHLAVETRRQGTWVRNANASRASHLVTVGSKQKQHMHHGGTASASHKAHLQTIQLLTERMNAMEAEQRKARSYMNNLEEENQRLRRQLQTMASTATTAAANSISPIEERIIARLEDSISSLTQQVEMLELDNITTSCHDHEKTSDTNASPRDIEQQHNQDESDLDP